MRIAMLVLVFGLGGILGLSAQSPNWDWVHQAGGSGEDSGSKVCYDPMGNMYVTGYFEGTASFGATNLVSVGGVDLFVAKSDAAGNWLWAVRGGGISHDIAWGIAATADGCYITGYFYDTTVFGAQTLINAGLTDIFVVRLSASGSWLWANSAGGIGMDSSWNLVLDAYGNCFLTGDFEGAAVFGSSGAVLSLGTRDTFVAAISPAGNWMWARSGGSMQVEYGYGITFSAGMIYITGTYTADAQFGPFPLICNGGSDIYIALLDTGGNWIYATSSSGSGEEYANDISRDDLGSVYICGSYYGEAVFESVSLPPSVQYNSFVIKCDMLGSCIWAVPFSSDSYNEAWGIAVNSNRGVFVTGSFNGQMNIGTLNLIEEGGADSFTVMLDQWGSPEWAKSIGGTEWDCTYSICANAEALGVTGYFTDACTADDQTLVAYGYMDVLLASIAHNTPLGIDISELNGNVLLTWQACQGAVGYHIYRSPNPYALDWGASYAFTTQEGWVGTGLTGDRWFFRVTADYGSE